MALDCRTSLGPYVKIQSVASSSQFMAFVLLTVGMRYCRVFKRPLSAQQRIESATIVGQSSGTQV
jgi:hypothetical protein